MNTATSDTLDATFAALADPTRRAILARLASGEASVTELAEPFSMSQPAISKHLKVLERAGLISRGRDAQRRPRRLEAQPLADANEWLERYREFWEGSFDRLDALLDEMRATRHPKVAEGLETAAPGKAPVSAKTARLRTSTPRSGKPQRPGAGARTSR
jgi:DNA-binding transcriptional ArsR family regulator